VRVQLSDVNEFQPQFARSSYYISALSTSPIGTALFMVSAVDGDGGDNVITYSILNPTENQVDFAVDSDGTVRNNRRFPNVPENAPLVKILNIVCFFNLFI